MENSTKCIFITISALFFSLICYGSWGPTITHYGVVDYEAGTQNWGIIQGRNNWLYIANNKGLLEYNGFKWKLYPINNHTVVRCLAASDAGDVYVGGRGEIGRFYEEQGNGELRYINLTYNMPDSLRDFKEIWAVHTIGELTYFQTGEEFFVYKGDSFINHLKSNSEISFSCKSSGSIYFVTREGAYVISGSSFSRLAGSEHIPLGDIAAIEPFGDNSILIATSTNGLFVYSGEHITPYITPFDDYLKANQIYSITYKEGSLAIGTIQRGVVIYNTLTTEYSTISVVNGLSNNTVLSTYFDNEGYLWLGLDKGINKINTTSPIMNFIPKDGDEIFTGYASLLYDNTVFMGTNRGAYISPYPFTDESLELVAGSKGQVWDIVKIDSTVYCCHHKGLLKFTGNKFESIYNTTGVWGISQIDSNRYLLSTYSGYKLLIEDNNNYITKSIGGFSESTREYLFDANNKVAWTLLFSKLYLHRFNDDYTEVESELLISAHGHRTMLGSYKGANIAYIDDKLYELSHNGEYHHRDDIDSVIDDIRREELQVKTDSDNNFWLYNESVLYLYNPSKEDNRLNLVSANKYHLINNFIDINNLSDSLALLNSIEGFFTIKLSDSTITKKMLRPKVYRIVSTNGVDSIIYRRESHINDSIKGITVPYKNNSLLFEFGSNSPNMDGLYFSYRLEGSRDKQTEWTEWVDFNFKEFIQLSGGNYTMFFRARDNQGNIVEDSFNFRVRPPLHRSAVMVILYFCVIFGGICAIALRYRRHTNMRLLEMAKRKKLELSNQRNKYASEMTNRENEINERHNSEKLEVELKRVSAELNTVLHHTIEKNDIVINTISEIDKIIDSSGLQISDINVKRLSTLKLKLSEKMVNNIDWSDFEKNFDIINDNFTKKLREQYAWMSVKERRLCVYIKLGLHTKEIAPLLNISVRGVEMMRYRMRKKVAITPNDSMFNFLHTL